MVSIFIFFGEGRSFSQTKIEIVGNLTLLKRSIDASPSFHCHCTHATHSSYGKASMAGLVIVFCTAFTNTVGKASTVG